MKTGNVAAVEMARTFNCGVGMIIVVGQDKVEAALQSLRENGEEEAFVIGQVTNKAGVEYVNMEQWQ
jgi:phosphoribosylamine--glycine ligase/phosphoribosylformylglycinamidine cyclo-ligase